MRLELIITRLRARCPTFATRVAGAAEFKPLQEATAIDVPAAFVIPLDDSPEQNTSMTTIRQAMNDSFAVIVAVSNATDEKGQGGTSSIHDLRAEVWQALLGWRPEERYDGILYEGGSLLSLDRDRLWYQFEFGALMEIDPDDSGQQVDLNALPGLQGVDLHVDGISPERDPNVAGTGPDGRVEHQASAPGKGVQFPQP